MKYLTDKRWRRLTAVALAVVLQLGLFVAWRAGWTHQANRGIYDQLMRFKPAVAPDDRILLVTLDEDSREILGKKIGQFTRSYFAAAIQNMTDDGVMLIGMDFDFSKPTFQDPAQDDNFANAVSYSSYVVLAKFVSGDGVTVKPLDLFSQYALNIANINLTEDPDSVVRRAPLVELEMTEEGEVPYMTMAAELAWWARAPEAQQRAISEVELPQFVPEEDEQGQVAAWNIAPLRVPVEGDLGFVNINYVGPSNTYPRISFGRVVRGEFPPGTFAGKIVLLGNTHPTGHDFYGTPMRNAKLDVRQEGALEIATKGSVTMAGVEVHANLLDTLLHDRYISSEHGRLFWAFNIGLALLALVAFWIFDIPTTVSLILLVILASIGGALPIMMFFKKGVFLPAADGLIALAVHFMGGSVFDRVVQGAEKANITAMFGRYLAPEVVAQLVDDPGQAKLGGEKVHMTVMFSDIRGFTTLSESMDPTALVNFLNKYLTRATNKIFEQQGVVDKYMGDAIMAFWGAPIKTKTHARQACIAALEMEKVVKEFRDLPENKGLPTIEVGIGVNTGDMTVGNMGSDMRFDYTVMGDAVNLASRLEGINKEYKTRTVISQSTLAELGDDFVTRELDLVKVKGKHEPVRIFELCAFKADRMKWAPRLKLFAEGLALYRAKAWDAAQEKFTAVLALEPKDGPATIYLERIEALRDTDLPEPWDGVMTMKTK